MALHDSNSSITFADDTTVVSLINNNNESAYREGFVPSDLNCLVKPPRPQQSFVASFKNPQLLENCPPPPPHPCSLSISSPYSYPSHRTRPEAGTIPHHTRRHGGRTKALDLRLERAGHRRVPSLTSRSCASRKQRRAHDPIHINGTAVERVSSFKFLGVHITEDQRTSQDITEDQRTSQDITEDQRTSQDITEDQRTSQDITEDQRTSQDITEDQRTSQDITEDQRTSQDITEDQRTSQDITEDQQHHHSGQEGATASLLSKAAEQIWHAAPGPLQILPMYH
ncbi:uncharacterized protein LOC127913597 [Oncorhynchus keta]|uniref:uncharacterized protein LOC127913597 n=1 Tax=Oncorhynchus keta TaxID=8018 RepID=UPI00227D4103|nr:uncharacterized protein LOC127913597 [Oncorhynchus keta]